MTAYSADILLDNDQTPLVEDKAFIPTLLNDLRLSHSQPVTEHKTVLPKDLCLNYKTLYSGSQDDLLLSSGTECNSRSDTVCNSLSGTACNSRSGTGCNSQTDCVPTDLLLNGHAHCDYSPADHDATTPIANNINAATLDEITLSPKSPSSHYSKSALQSSSGCIIQAILLSYWDNILGPKIRHLWYNENQDGIARDTCYFVAGQTLNGEICRDHLDSHIDTKFYVISERNILAIAFIFSGLTVVGRSIYSLSLLVPHSEMKRYLAWHELCVAWVTRLVSKLRILLEKDCGDEAIERFSSYLPNFILMLKSLKLDGLQETKPSIETTALHPDHHVDQLFLQQAICSHLMTCRRSVVIGQSASNVNIMISTLAMFLSPSERMCSRYVNQDHPYPYHHDLCVQGMLTSWDGMSSTLKDLVFSKYPTSLIDVGSSVVQQSQPRFSQHHSRCQQVKRDELIQLWVNKRSTDIYPSRGLFIKFEDSNSLVKHFLEELLQLHPGCGVRETYIDDFLRLIDKKASSLLRYVASVSNDGHSNFKGSVKKLKSDLSLTVQGDFYMVLAAAELLKPGIYSFVMGFSKADMEQMHFLLDTL